MPKVVKTEEIEIQVIKHVANARFRNLGDVADMIKDIKESGQLQPVAIRLKDNALIYGNRRVEAFEKLGIKKIRAEFFDIDTDTELMVMNIRENLKRKELTSVEYGRAIHNMQKANESLTLSEVAAMLSIPLTRARSLLQVYNIVAGTPYEKYVVRGGKVQGIPENFVEKCYTLISRTRINKRLSNRDWDILLEAAKNREITMRELPSLKKICFAKPNIQMELAIEMLKDCKVVEVDFPCNERVLQHELSLTKHTSEREFLKSIIRKYNRELLF